ncbi:hypothetical protein JOD07_003096 [Defluviitalea raffinosedens]|nr:hypothetical protein [Defluviitalea raffinosedens]
MRSKIGSKILGLAIALALVGELSNVLNFLLIPLTHLDNHTLV